MPTDEQRALWSAIRANPDDDTCILAARPATGQTGDLRRYLTPR